MSDKSLNDPKVMELIKQLKTKDEDNLTKDEDRLLDYKKMLQQIASQKNTIK